MLYLLCCLLAAAAHAQDVAQRLAVRAGQTLAVPLPGVETVMSIEERIAQVAVTPTGFTIVGKSTGDTIVQAFTATAMQVFVVNVESPPVPPPGPGPLPNINDHGAITSFWGDNRYQLQYSDSTLLGRRFDNLLTFHGRAGQGEYQSSTQFTTGALGDHLQYATVGWLNDGKTLALEVGDVVGRLFGSAMGGSAPVRGIRSSVTRKFGGDHGEWTGEVFAGELRSAADPYATRLIQPAAGADVSGNYAPYTMPNLRLSFGSSLLAFSTSRISIVQPGESGALAGLVARAVLKDGIGLELRSSLSLAAPRQEGGRLAGVPGVGITAQHRNHDGQERVEYERVQPGQVLPQNGGPTAGYETFSGSFERHARGVSLTGSASYGKITDLAGQAGGGLSYQLGTTLPLTRQTRLTLGGGRSTVARPMTLLDGSSYMRSWTRTFASSHLDHVPVSGSWSLLSDLGLSKTEAAEGDGLSASGTVALQKRRAPEGKWEGSGVLSTTVNQVHVNESVLAVDQPPLDVTVAGTGQGRFVQGPFESFGGLGLQVMASPRFEVAPRFNIGFRFTPTAAHQLVATYDTARWMQSGRWIHSVSASYTYHFGDAVRAVPIFEFMSYGAVEGRICYDENADGNCQADEPPLPDIPLVLSNGMRTKSRDDGSYRFDHVKPGFYHLDVDEDAMREKGRPTTVLAAAFDLPVRGEERKSFAVARACHIRGHLVHDLDADGKAGENEPLFGGPLVVAHGAAGDVQARVTAAGTFAMTVPCGDYDVEIETASLPAMHVALDEEAVHVTTTIGEAPVVKLLVGSVRTIAGMVYVDKNGNGERDADEPGVAGARVRFGKAAGITDETGAYLLRHLPTGAGELTVDADSLPAGMRPGAPLLKNLPVEPAALDDIRLPVLPAP